MGIISSNPPRVQCDHCSDILDAFASDAVRRHGWSCVRSPITGQMVYFCAGCLPALYPWRPSEFDRRFLEAMNIGWDELSHE